jgi:hypothetical protein
MRLVALDGEGQHWYVGKQLRKPIVLSIEPPPGAGEPSKDDCSGNAVVFRTKEGTLLPDTAMAEWDVSRGKCLLRARWKLGDVVGTTQAQATIVGSKTPPLTLNASAHALPWLGFGLAWTRVSAYDRVAQKTKSFRVARRFATVSGLDSAEIAYDSVDSRTIPDLSTAQSVLSPTIGANFPLSLWAEGAARIRLSVAADIKRPLTDWFVGASPLRLFSGLASEAIGGDIQLVLHISRRELLKDKTGCSSGNGCEVRPTTRVVGAGVMVQVSGETVLSTLVGAIAKI